MAQSAVLADADADAGGSRDTSTSVRALHQDMLSVSGNPTLKHIGETYGMSAAQIAIRWTLQRGALAMPCAKQRAHQEQNLQAGSSDCCLKLSSSDMDRIARLDIPELSPLGVYGFGDPADSYVETTKARSIAGTARTC